MIRALDAKIQQKDQRIDRRAGGITLQKLFEASRAGLRGMISKGDAEDQTPGAVGNFANAILLQTPPLLAAQYNSFASSRSIYGRLYSLLKAVGDNSVGDDQLFAACQKAGGFVIRREKNGNANYISRERFIDYTNFLIEAGFLVKPKGQYQLTSDGRLALNPQEYNKRLLDAIEANVFPASLTFDGLESIITQLLDDLIPPTPSKIEERLQLISEKPVRMTHKLRFALQVLPGTGRFLKGSADALFLAEV